MKKKEFIKMLEACSEVGYDAPYIDDQGTHIVYDGQFVTKEVKDYKIAEVEIHIEKSAMKYLFDEKKVRADERIKTLKNLHKEIKGCFWYGGSLAFDELDALLEREISKKIVFEDNNIKEG